MSPGQPVPADHGPFVYVEDLDRPTLAPDDEHHLSRVRRLRPGDPVVLGDGRGRWCRARFAGRPEPLEGAHQAQRPEPPVTIAFALTKGAKPELTVQKLTELGVDIVIPFGAGRSIVRWDEARQRTAHGRLVRVAREAGMQSRQPWGVEIAPVADFATVAALAGACRADRDGAPPTLARPVVLIGPEGGWDDDERGVDMPTVGLGPGVLRAETAAIAAGAVMAALRAGLVAPG